MTTLTGSCLCGAVRYRLPDEFAYMGYCHCTECQKTTGSAFTSVGGLSETAFEITAGSTAITHFEKSADSLLGFCTTCGSQLYSRKPAAGMIHLRLGTLDTPPTQRPTFHIFVRSLPTWYAFDDDLPRYEEWMPRG